jgi:hypothetical protein
LATKPIVTMTKDKKKSFYRDLDLKRLRTTALDYIMANRKKVNNKCKFVILFPEYSSFSLSSSTKLLLINYFYCNVLLSFVENTTTETTTTTTTTT